MIKFNPPDYVAQILFHLTENNHDAYIVGGCVRDAVMGRPVHDWDIATSAAPVHVALLFPKTVLTGEKFGTVTVVLPECSVEVTTFRTEGGYKDGRRPEHVEFVSSLEEDLSRRDFTMNAMAVSVAGEFIDMFGGIEDITKRVVRCVGDPNTRFSEDALRMFRAYRFSAELGFMLDDETMEAIHANANRALLLSAERVRVELEKVLMSQRPDTIGAIITSGLLARYISETKECPDGLERIEELPVEPVMRWCALCAILLEDHLIASPMDFLHSMHLDGRTVRICSRALSIPKFPDGRTGVKRLFSKYGVDAVRYAAAIQDVVKRGSSSAAQSEPRESSSSTSLARIDDIIASGECFSLSKLAISGSDLIAIGYSPGHRLGEMLDILLNHVLENPEDNTREKLLEIAR